MYYNFGIIIKNGGIFMHIQCTKKVLDFIKPKITDKDTDGDMYAAR